MHLLCLLLSLPLIFAFQGIPNLSRAIEAMGLQRPQVLWCTPAEDGDGAFSIPISKKCDGVKNCPDGSDEVGCPKTTEPPKTAPKTDETPKPEKKDEENVSPFTSLGFLCDADWNLPNGFRKRIPLSKKCDGVKDCQKGEDEIGCPDKH